MKLALFLLAVSAFGSSATLTWTDTANPAGTQYNVWRADGPCIVAPAYSKINVALISPKTYVDSSVLPGQTYCFAVTAVSSTSLESIKSVPVVAVVPLPTSAAPSGLTVSVIQ